MFVTSLSRINTYGTTITKNYALTELNSSTAIHPSEMATELSIS